ncbi:MAG: glycosyltransferase family 2 protein [Coleofasciculus sp. S288]|nr:glycosyltransferase family 2 protein [Coleofasciculus sp. S288]
MNKNPQVKPSLSLCMIVKNERQNLPRCLASVKSYVDEMIIVDTGSQDGTPKVADEYGAKVTYFEWCDDFAAARNYAISQSSGDWILMLDADEELVVELEDFLAQLNLYPKVVAYCLLRYNDTQESPQRIAGNYVMRLFRNSPEIKYVSRFHEYINYQNQAFNRNWISYVDGLKIRHHSYNEEQIQHKILNRNIPLLERIRQQEELSLMLLYCLAEFYKHTQQPEKSKEIYAEALARLYPHLEDGSHPEPFNYIPSLMYELGKELLLEEDYETIQLICQRGLEWCSNYPPLNLLAGATLRALGFPLGAIAYFQECLQLGKNGNYYRGEPFVVNYMTTYPAYDMGNVYIDLECPQEALAAFEIALSFDANFTAARRKIDKIKQFLAAKV